jgi:pimeloyl-ACP methyl ester carboxylesterase
VISKDGTIITYTVVGVGVPVILVDGAMGYRLIGPMKALAEELSQHFAVYTYDRRGRGESTDNPPYAVEREIEDIEALIHAAGGSAYLYGASSGAVLALKAAAALDGAKVEKLALYAPPLSFGDEAKQEYLVYTRQMDELIHAGRNGDAVAFFLADMLPPDMIDNMRRMPEWPLMEAVAPTIAYDNAVLGDGALPVEASQAATMPVLILDGAEGPAFLHEASATLAAAMPHAQLKAHEGQTHGAPPQALSPFLVEFFKLRVTL